MSNGEYWTGKPPDSQECQPLEDMHLEGVEEMVPMQKKLSNGSQLVMTPSRTLHFQNQKSTIPTLFCTMMLI